MKKVLSLLIVLAMVVAPQTAFAQTYGTATISAGGSLAASASVLTVSGGPLTFNSDGSTTTVGAGTPNEGQFVISQADQLLTVQFSDNHPGTQIITISTSNGTRVDPIQGTVPVGAGLVGETDNTEVAPLRWKVFPQVDDQIVAVEFEDGSTGSWTVDGYNGYVFADDTKPDGSWFDVNGNGSYDGGEENKYGEIVGSYIADQDVSWTANDIDFATVAYNINGSAVANAQGNLVMFYPTPDNNIDPAQQIVIDYGVKNTALADAMSVTNGTFYLRMMADYTGRSAQNYSTSTLTLELATKA